MEKSEPAEAIGLSPADALLVNVGLEPLFSPICNRDRVPSYAETMPSLRWRVCVRTCSSGASERGAILLNVALPGEQLIVPRTISPFNE